MKPQICMHCADFKTCHTCQGREKFFCAEFKMTPRQKHEEDAFTLKGMRKKAKAQAINQLWTFINNRKEGVIVPHRYRNDPAKTEGYVQAWREIYDYIDRERRRLCQ